MASVLDVAAYILEKQGEMTTMKLQKLVYYSQAWSLVWDEKPLFSADIEAWANGPVCRKLYAAHRGEFRISSIEGGTSRALDEAETETVDAVLCFYGDKGSHWLSQLTHMEAPWKDARGDVKPGQRCSEVISHDSMAEYYDSLPG